MPKEKVNTSIANRAMLRFAKEYAEKNGYIEGEVKEDRFWGNEADKLMHPKKPEVVLVSYAAPVSEEVKKKQSHWSVPRVEIDSYWGNPRIAMVDPEKNFCSLSYNGETNEFEEGQFWRKKGLEFAQSVKNTIELYIQMMKDGYDMKVG